MHCVVSDNATHDPLHDRPPQGDPGRGESESESQIQNDSEDESEIQDTDHNASAPQVQRAKSVREDQEPQTTTPQGSVASRTPSSSLPLEVGSRELPITTRNSGPNLQRRNVYVSGLPETMRAADFRELCRNYGRVEASKLCTDSKNRPTKGYGFVLFFKETDAAECIKGLNGRWMSGRTLQARLADAAATPSPLDPNSAHPPITRQRYNYKLHRTSAPSMNSVVGVVDLPLVLSSKRLPHSLSASSSQEISPPLTPQHLGLSTSLVARPPPPPGPGTAPFFFSTPLEQSMNCPMTAFSPQQGYMSLSTPLLSPSMMGMPVYFAMPSSTATVAGSAPQQLVFSSAVMAPGATPAQLYSSLVYSP